MPVVLGYDSKHYALVLLFALRFKLFVIHFNHFSKALSRASFLLLFMVIMSVGTSEQNASCVLYSHTVIISLGLMLHSFPSLVLVTLALI